MTDTKRHGRYELYVFDWDGTVMDTTALIARGIQEAARALALPVPDLEVARCTIGLGVEETMAIVAPSLPRERWEEFQKAYRDWYIVREAEVFLFPHLRELLDGMRRHGIRMAIATGKSRRGLNRVFEKTGIGSYFEVTKTADECFSKPHPQMLEEIFLETGVAPEDAVMIGDTGHDLQLAVNGRCHSVGVTYGAAHREELEALPHDALADNVDELAVALGLYDILQEELARPAAAPSAE